MFLVVLAQQAKVENAQPDKRKRNQRQTANQP